MDQLVSFAGAILILAAYGANQFGVVERQHWLYSASNLVGSVLLTIVAVGAQQWGFVLLEGVWAVMSVPPLVAALRARGTAV
jgi:hypothetical protein